LIAFAIYLLLSLLNWAADGFRNIRRAYSEWR